MAVHVPLSHGSNFGSTGIDAYHAHNMLNPQDGSPVTLAVTGHGISGLYYLTKVRKQSDGDNVVLGEGMKFYSPEEVVIALNEKGVWTCTLTEILVRVLVEPMKRCNLVTRRD